jgi:hypothetical protein
LYSIPHSEHQVENLAKLAKALKKKIREKLWKKKKTFWCLNSDPEPLASYLLYTIGFLLVFSISSCLPPHGLIFYVYIIGAWRG